MSSEQTRGAFIVLEGLDRSGKSTQVRRLVESLNEKGRRAEAARFPDRTTTIGKMIDAYLTSAQEMDDRAIHLLFSANRWERARQIDRQLSQGITIICDRYAFSGIAFSAAKGLDYDWCKSPDIGLLKPDFVCFLNVDPSIAQQRGGFGEERYETKEMQANVASVFEKIAKVETSLNWRTIDAGNSLAKVGEDIQAAVSECFNQLSAQTQWILFQ